MRPDRGLSIFYILILQYLPIKPFLLFLLTFRNRWWLIWIPSCRRIQFSFLSLFLSPSFRLFSVHIHNMRFECPVLYLTKCPAKPCRIQFIYSVLRLHAHTLFKRSECLKTVQRICLALSRLKGCRMSQRPPTTFAFWTFQMSHKHLVSRCLLNVSDVSKTYFTNISCLLSYSTFINHLTCLSGLYNANTYFINYSQIVSLLSSFIE